MKLSKKNGTAARQCCSERTNTHQFISDLFQFRITVEDGLFEVVNRFPALRIRNEVSAETLNTTGFTAYRQP